MQKYKNTKILKKGEKKNGKLKNSENTASKARHLIDSHYSETV